MGENSGGGFEEADSKMALADEETVGDLAIVSTHRTEGVRS